MSVLAQSVFRLILAVVQKANYLTNRLYRRWVVFSIHKPEVQDLSTIGQLKIYFIIIFLSFGFKAFLATNLNSET